jgi:cysteine synthase A
LWEGTPSRRRHRSSGAQKDLPGITHHAEEFVGKTIVVVLPDSGERYLSGALFEGIFDPRGMAT